MIFVFALVFTFVVDFIFIFVFVLLLAMLAHEMRNKKAADAGATQQTTRNEELQDTMLLVASLLTFFTQLFAFFVAAAFA